MGSRRPAEDCMFCAPDPCVCSGAATKKPPRPVEKVARPAPPAAVVEAKTVAQPRRAGLGSMRSMAVQLPRPQAPIKPLGMAALPEREDSLTSAIRLMYEAGLIDEAELRRHREDMKMSDEAFEQLVRREVTDGIL